MPSGEEGIWEVYKGIYVYVHPCACIYCVVTGVGVHGSIRVVRAPPCACVPLRLFQNKRPDALFYARQVVAFVFYFCRQLFAYTFCIFSTNFFIKFSIFQQFFYKISWFSRRYSSIWPETRVRFELLFEFVKRVFAGAPSTPANSTSVLFFFWLPSFGVFSVCPPFRFILHECTFNVQNTCIVDWQVAHSRTRATILWNLHAGWYRPQHSVVSEYFLFLRFKWLSILWQKCRFVYSRFGRSLVKVVKWR